MENYGSTKRLVLLCFSLFLMQYRGECKVETIEFNKGFAPLFGDGNIARSDDDKSVHLHLNQYTGMFRVSRIP